MGTREFSSYRYKQRERCEDRCGLAELKERIEDLEVEVYGYDRSDDLSAGEEVVVNLKQTVVFLEKQHRQRTDEDEQYVGVPLEQVYDIAAVLGIDCDLANQAYEKLRRQGEVRRGVKMDPFGGGKPPPLS